MAFAGNLQDIPLPDILQLLAGQGKSGVLTLRRGDEEVRIAIADGQAVDADSSHRPLDQRLGTMLVNTGKLDRGDLERALELQRSRGVKLGRVLVDEGMAQAQDVRRALLLQFLQIIYTVLGWSDGSYDFERREVDYDRDQLEPVGFQKILMDCMRMIDEWPVLHQRLSNRRLVLHRTPRPDAPGPEAPAPAGADRGAHADESWGDVDGGGDDLSELEAEIYQRVDGRATVQQIIDRSMHLEFDVCRALHHLWQRDWIRPAFQGQLEEVDFPGLLQAIRRAGGTGRLELHRAGTVKTVLFRDGHLADARSSDPDDGIGPWLLRCGLVARRDLDRVAAAAAVDPGVDALGRLLGVEPERLRRALADQAAEVIRSLFAWTDGSYDYQPCPSAARQLDLEWRTPAIVVSGIRSIDRWSRLAAAVGPDDRVYRCCPPAGVGSWDDLGGEERRWLELFADGRTVAEACDLADLPAFELHQLVWAGRILGLLEGGELSLALRTLVAAVSGAPVEEPAAEPAVASAGETVPGAPPGAPATVPTGTADDLIGLADLDPSELVPDLAAAEAPAAMPVRLPPVQAPVPPARAAAASAAPALPRQGAVTGAGLGETLRLLYQARRSGVLVVSHRHDRVGLLLKHGTVVAARSPDPNHRIGDIAVRLGLVNEAMVAKVLSELQDGALGPELVARGLLAPDELERVVATQIRELVLPMFNWAEARFELQDRPPGARELPCGGLTSAELILAGAREMTATGEIGDRLRASGRLGPHPDPHLRFQRVRLQAEEAFLLERLTGRATLSDLVAVSPVDERETVRIVFGLLAAGLVAPLSGPVADHEAAQLVAPVESPPLGELAALLERLRRLDPHAVLGVAPDASREAIAWASARLARKYHPDHGQSLTDKVKLETIFAAVIAARDAVAAPVERELAAAGR